MLARQLAGDAGRLEQRVSQFNHAVNDGNATLDEAAELANGLFGLSLRAPQNAQRDNLRRILLASDQLVAAPIDLAKIRPQVGDHFSALMQAWLRQLYTNQTFDLTAQQLQSNCKCWNPAKATPWRTWTASPATSACCKAWSTPPTAPGAAPPARTWCPATARCWTARAAPA